jgi:hypothetical protein
MTSSETSTDAGASTRLVASVSRPAGTSGGAWRFFLLIGMLAATVAVALARDTQPAALILLSAAVLGAALVGMAMHRAMSGFFSDRKAVAPMSSRAREELEREKALALRSIKELQFDHAMGKVSEADFKEIGGRLRARAMTLIQDLERASHAPPVVAPSKPASRAAGACASCGTVNDPDAKFCKQCGTKLGR